MNSIFYISIWLQSEIQTSHLPAFQIHGIPYFLDKVSALKRVQLF